MSETNERSYPPAQRVAQHLREQIEQGHYRPGEWLPTERALALEYGVDRTAVRTALSELAAQRLIVREPRRRPWVAHQTEPEATRNRRVTAGSALRTIAMIVPHHPSFPAALALISGANAGLRWSGKPYRLVVFDTHGTADGMSGEMEERALNAVEEEGIAGAILWHNGGERTVPRLRQLLERQIPVVLVDRNVPGTWSDLVGIDNRSAARDAVEYMLKLGHRRIAYLTQGEQPEAIRERADGYREALQRAGIRPAAELVYTLPCALRPELGPALDHFLSLAKPPTAVFAMNDALAHFFLAEVATRGMRVPDDLSVIGFDDLERFSPRPALLTTVHQPFELIGQRAAELLVRRLSTPTRPSGVYQHLMLPTSLAIRSTCRTQEEKHHGQAEPSPVMVIR